MKKVFFKIISLTIIVTHLASVCLKDVAFAQEASPDSFSPERALKNFYLDPYSGALNLSIPLNIPPGRKGVQPSLNLTYSSRNANGPFGWGWNMDFLGYIERSTKNGVPKYDATDTFVYVFGGAASELVSVGGGEYRLKNQGNSLNLRYNGTSWTVKDAQGTTYYFGRDYTSCFVNRDYSYTDLTKVFRWKIDGIRDIHGNALYISYRANEAIPTKIGYTTYQPGSDEYLKPSDAPFSIVFKTNSTTMPREDRSYNYRSGSQDPGQEDYVKEIIVQAYPFTVIKKYLLDYKYSASAHRLLLTKITETAPDGTAMPVLSFTYQENPLRTFQVLPVSSETSVTGDNLWNIRVDDSVENNQDWANWDGNVPPELYPGLGFGYGMDWGEIHTQPSGSDRGVSWNISPSGDLSISGVKSSAFHAWTYVYVRNDNSLNLNFNGNIFFTIFLNGNYANPHTSENDPHYIGPGVPSKTILLKAGYNLIEITGYSRTNDYNFNLSANIPSQVEFMNSQQAAIPTLSGDFNADGRDDIGTFYSSTGKVEVALSNGSTFLPKQAWIENFGVNQRLLLGDFNGDSKADICAFDAASGSFRIALSDGTRFNDAGVWLSGFGAGQKVSAGEFNGDGKTDLCTFFNELSIVHIQSAFNRGGSFEKQPSDLTLGSSYSPALLGDFSADGLTDFVSEDSYYRGEYKVFFVYTGSSKTSNGDWSNSAAIGSYSPLIADFSGDGLSDIGYYDYASGKIKVMTFNGISFSATSTDLPFEFQLKDASIQIQTGDYNGDGIQDFAAYNALGNLEVALSAGTDIPDLLSKVDNGLGATLDLKYSPSSKFDNTRQDGSSGLPFTIPVLTESIASDGRGNSYKTEYSYAGGLYDIEDKELRGFAYTKVIDPEGISAESYFHQDDTYKGKLYKQEIRDKDGKLFSRAENSWNYLQPYPGVYFPFVAKADSYIYSQDQPVYTQTQQLFEYDQYGNPTKITSNGKVENGQAITGDEKTLVSEYSYNTTDWILGLPKHTYILDAKLNKVSEKWFYYDGSASIDAEPVRGLLTKEEDLLYNPLDGSESRIPASYAYDSYGNIISATDALGRATTIAYETTLKAYPLTTTNPKGQAVTTIYDTKLGKLLSSTDPNNQTSTNIYDALGQLIKVIGPNDTQDSPGIIYEYDLASQPAKIIKKVKSDYLNPANYLSYYSFYDGLGRLIQEKSPAEADPETAGSRQIISGMAIFDSKGKVKKEYFPYFAAESPDFVNTAYDTPHSEFTYDALGRITRITNPDLTFSSAVYSGWDKTITDENNHSKTETYDAYGRVIRVEEHNQGLIYATNYEYDALDNLIRLTDSQGNVTLIWYDSLGRKLKMDEPDMGVWAYEYDAVGNLIKQTNTKGQVLVFAYDDLNRLVSKADFPGPIIVPLATYVYDDSSKPNCIGRLSKVIDNSGSTEFFYDNLGREIKSTKTVNGSGGFTVERSYDAMDRLLTLKYPDGDIVNYAYNPQGIASVTGSSGKIFISNMDYSPTGQITKINYGNGAETNYSYNPNTLRLSELITQSSQGIIQHLNYQFDNTGNISQIIDNVNTATQSFSYDDLNRLTRAEGAYGSFNYEYDAIGNMLHKEGVNLSYGKNTRLPHAATQYGATLIDYDANGNMIHKGASPEEGIFLTYNVEDRLIKVEDKNASAQQTINITLGPGWNFFSLPLLMPDLKISSVLSSISGKFSQVSRYNANTKNFEHYVGNPAYDDFDAFEFGRGYQIYISGSETLTLSLTGTVPVTEQSNSLNPGYNLIFSPVTTNKPAEEALLPLQLGVDYSKVLSYDKASGLFKEYSAAKKEFTELQPGFSYYLYSLKDALWTIPYSPDGVSAVTAFVYDGDGGRVKKTLPSGLSTTYIGSLYEKDSDGVLRKHIFAGSNRIATSLRDAAGVEAISYYHSDHLGSSNVITDESGQQAGLTEFTPFGSISKQTGTFDPEHKFTGKELDNTGFYYYGARYYHPQLGRFISADTVGTALWNPQTLNRYSYCLNNPLRYIDPDGEVAIEAFLIYLGNAVKNGVISGLQAGAGTAIVSGGAAYARTGDPLNAFLAGTTGFARGFTSGFIAGTLSGLGIPRAYARPFAGTITGFIFGDPVTGLAGGLASGLSGLQNPFMASTVGSLTGEIFKPIGLDVGGYSSPLSQAFNAYMDSTLNEQFTFSSTSGTFLNSPVNSLAGDLTLGLTGLSGSFTAWGDVVIANSFSYQDISTGSDPFSLTGAFSDYMDSQLDFTTDFYYSGFDF